MRHFHIHQAYRTRSPLRAVPFSLSPPIFLRHGNSRQPVSKGGPRRGTPLRGLLIWHPGSAAYVATNSGYHNEVDRSWLPCRGRELSVRSGVGTLPWIVSDELWDARSLPLAGQHHEAVFAVIRAAGYLLHQVVVLVEERSQRVAVWGWFGMRIRPPRPGPALPAGATWPSGPRPGYGPGYTKSSAPAKQPQAGNDLTS